MGDLIRVTKEAKTYEGLLIPRSEYGDEKHVVIKMKSGYNVGIRVTPNTHIQKIGVGTKPTFTPPPLPKQKPGLPKVAIISTGGTIASRVDYRTGGVRSALSASDLYSVVPELSEVATIDARILFSLYSENITAKHWSEAAKTVAKHIQKGAAGVVVPHGTDTMAYTAAALSFALQNLPVPVIMVGSQRSADRPSSDAATNLIGAVRAAAWAPFAEVVLVMHETISDTFIVLHRGTKVRKCHTSRRDTFQSVNALPLARMENEKITMLVEDYRQRDLSRKLVLKPDFDEKVALVKSHPGLNPKVLKWYVEEGCRGIILEGTGLGHVSSYCFSAIRQAVKNNVVVAMTSQCIWGRLGMNVYDTGRDLLAMGVIPLEDMLPETALVKLMWALGQTKDVEEVKKLLITNIAHEISPRTAPEEEE
ncbi:MAG: Glu-tRNA(Gln) amidotransferase subunit GatD [Candidatus Bathyarchaeota archaeon]|nr:Glu-tRNA(Gln) amidotransferase subunit GatD [Candidatus Bathyarchaeota archaeon]MDH5532028.1 Glu-tRNA(Gln) amidotransferase subunit GatD [Candidatus Bathyarchaeota archaeon]MDH5712417.1 Glu-tRNA(Gln) amidotransferase subunit GatD [Candidatus Bathyarchaeota archaeon]